jgi:glycosyltransferase involved in cell wall biosynthesis
LFGDYIHEIIFIDDNSQDGTRAAIAALADVDDRIKSVYRRPPNGVGLALGDGIRAATGQYLLLIDCDFQHLLPEVRDLFDAIGTEYEVAIGSRFSRHSVMLNYPFMKIVANRLFHGIAQIVLLRRFRDLTNNLKLIPRMAAERLVLLESGFAANAEIGLQLLIMGYRLKEVPISWIGRGYDMGGSSFRLLSEGGSYWRVLCRIWLRRFVGVGVYRDVPSKPRGK